MRWKWLFSASVIVVVMVYITYDDFGFWPSLGFFSLVILAAFYLYRQDSRSLSAIMQPLVTQYGGVLRPATMMSFPRLHFEVSGRSYSVQAMPTAGPNARSGPFTSVHVLLPFDSALRCEVKRKPALIRSAVASLAPEWQATTGDAAFDKAFRLAGRDQTILAKLLSAGLRARLLATQLRALHLRISDSEINVFIDGLAKRSDEIEEMIYLANALADRCVPQ